MKKLILSAVFASLVLTSCGGDDDAGFDCVAQTNDVSAKASAYASDPSNANCAAYRSSLQAFLDNGCTGGQSGSFQAIIDGLDCN